jgi:hypothetical protein
LDRVHRIYGRASCLDSSFGCFCLTIKPCHRLRTHGAYAYWRTSAELQ